jgi:ubiquitin conjugation factor E4 B
MDEFLLPKAGTHEAQQLIRPQSNNFLQMITGEVRPYKRRSGPALEKHTLLGACLRLGTPRINNPSFTPTSILTQSLDSIERINTTQRNQLRGHQQACCQFVNKLVFAGPEARQAVMTWFQDALLVNTGADALRPDPSKVSSTSTLLNLSVVLLKLCEPVVENPDDRIKLVHPGFIMSEQDHGGVFASRGDNAVRRLGENVNGMEVDYSPKNTFVPQCFWYCARSLHYGLNPAMSAHENLLRHISHLHWELSNAGRDIRSDPQFGVLLCRQRSAEVALYQPEMVTDTLRFCNFMARVLYEMEDSVLRTMPEDFVSDLCGIIISIAKLKPRLLQGIDFRYVFKLSVKLLSANYAMVRVYRWYCLRWIALSHILSSLLLLDGPQLQSPSHAG